MKLLFVYNANSGKRNSFLDSLYKVLSPETYSCSLCKITYGIFKVKPEWQFFKETTALDLDFYHLDEFISKFGNTEKAPFKYPVILTEKERVLDVFISKEELDHLKNETELIELINSRITVL